MAQLQVVVLPVAAPPTNAPVSNRSNATPFGHVELRGASAAAGDTRYLTSPQLPRPTSVSLTYRMADAVAGYLTLEARANGLWTEVKRIGPSARMLNTRGVSSFNDYNTNNTRILPRKTCI